jgi:16S rRNA processing protein RimM
LTAVAGRGKRILLGRIAGAHGVRGEVLIRSYTAESHNIASYGPLSDEHGNRSFEITKLRVTRKGVVARLKGVEDRASAEALAGLDLYAARERLPATAEGEFYYADLIGLAAVDTNGAPIGTIVGVHNYGAGDIIEVRLTGSETTELVPFTAAFVPDVDIAEGRAVVVLPGSTEGGTGKE